MGPLFVTRQGELVWSLTPPHAASPSHESGKGHGPTLRQTPTAAETTPAWAVVERFVNGKPKPAGDGLSPTQVNYFHGSDRA